MKKSSIQCSREWRDSLHFKTPIKTTVYPTDVKPKSKKKCKQ